MTRDEMIEKLAKHMGFVTRASNDVSKDEDEHWLHTGKYGQDLLLHQAAAVLDLCGPKPLEWHQIGSANWVADTYNVAQIRHNPAVFSLADSLSGISAHATLEAAQAAAQAHADAAHWANTRMGDV